MKQIYSICLNFLMNLLRTALRETGGIVITTNPDVNKNEMFLKISWYEDGENDGAQWHHLYR